MATSTARLARPVDTRVPTYSLAERDRRWNLARRLMDEEGVDCLLVHGEREGTGPAPFAFDTWFTNDRPGSTVLFPRDGEPVSLVPLPMYISDHFEAAQRGYTNWIEAEHVHFGQHPGVVAARLRQLGLERATLGVVGAEPYPPYYFVPPLPFALRAGLQRELPQLEYKPVGHRLALLSSTQSDEEIAVIRHAASIGDAMVRAMLAATAPGQRESDVFAAGIAAAHERGVVAPSMLLWSGPESIAWGPPAWLYRPVTPRQIEAGDVILAEVFVSFGMKETQHQVTIAVGEVHNDFERAARMARASYDAGLEKLRPGRRFGEVVEAMRRPVEDADGSFVHPVVHALNPFGAVSGVPLGIGELPGAEAYHIHAEIPPIMHDLVLQPGMTFAFEPNCAFGRRVANIGGTVIVGEDAPVQLNPMTAELLRVDA